MIYVVTGRRELGKTTLARYLAHAKSPRIIVDPRAQWPNDDDVEPYDLVDTGAMLTDLHDGADVIMQPDQLQASVDALAAVAKEHIRSMRSDDQFSIVFDEAGLYHLRAWDWVMRCSPRSQTAIVLTAHRPQDVSTDVRALTDHWCLFRTTQEHDLDVIEDRCGDRVRALVQTLDRYQFVEWDDARGQVRLHRDGRKWKTPSTSALSGDLDRRHDLFGE